MPIHACPTIRSGVPSCACGPGGTHHEIDTLLTFAPPTHREQGCHFMAASPAPNPRQGPSRKKTGGYCKEGAPTGRSLPPNATHQRHLEPTVTPFFPRAPDTTVLGPIISSVFLPRNCFHFPEPFSISSLLVPNLSHVPITPGTRDAVELTCVHCEMLPHSFEHGNRDRALSSPPSPSPPPKGMDWRGGGNEAFCRPSLPAALSFDCPLPTTRRRLRGRTSRSLTAPLHPLPHLNSSWLFRATRKSLPGTACRCMGMVSVMHGPQPVVGLGCQGASPAPESSRPATG
mmetsp:Transcript_18675/g.29743  ORF Transcript_18675/g.29743 Transcript_18675/m.29743 type:complete len:287 (-) Transcript_18675:166-1026(-)